MSFHLTGGHHLLAGVDDGCDRSATAGTLVKGGNRDEDGSIVDSGGDYASDCSFDVWRLRLRLQL